MRRNLSFVFIFKLFITILLLSGAYGYNSCHRSSLKYTQDCLISSSTFRIILSSCYDTSTVSIVNKHDRRRINHLSYKSSSVSLLSSCLLFSSLHPTTEETTTILTVEDATNILQKYDQEQQAYIQKQQPTNINPGIHTLDFCKNHVSLQEKKQLRQAVEMIVSHANHIRARRRVIQGEVRGGGEGGGGSGRVMLGLCAQHVEEGIFGLKSFVSSLNLPRGLLHGMDVDGIPIPSEDLGSVYIKYNTGGCQTFTELRESGLGLEALWKPGDAFLERYDGDYRGVYLNVELEDGIFRQYGILPMDLFFETKEDDEEW